MKGSYSAPHTGHVDSDICMGDPQAHLNVPSSKGYTVPQEQMSDVMCFPQNGHFDVFAPLMLI